MDRALNQAVGLDLDGLEASWAESAIRGHIPDGWIDLANRFDIEVVQAHLDALTTSQMAGRQSGSPGAEAAAAYIAGKFAEYGLLPAGDDPGTGPTYFQRLPADYASMVEAPQVTIFEPSGGVAATLVHRQDLLTVFDQVVTRGEATGEVVYIRDFDYGEMDLTGKIVLRCASRSGPCRRRFPERSSMGRPACSSWAIWIMNAARWSKLPCP